VARPSPGVARVVAVLNHLSAHADQAFGLSELSRRLDINKATAHALLAELTDAGYVVRDPITKAYGLGPQLLAVGLSAGRQGNAAIDAARPHLRRLATALDSRCVATTVLGDDMVVLEAAGRDRPLGPSLLPGHRIPFDPPLGTAFLVGADRDEVDRWLARAGDVPPDERQRYLDAIDAVRRHGCSMSLDADTRPVLHEAVVHERSRRVTDLVHELGRQSYLLLDLEPDERYRLSVVVAPVVDAAGKVVLGLTAYDLRGTRSADEVAAVADLVREAATAVTLAIGGTPVTPQEALVRRPTPAPRGSGRRRGR
jgi:DNA-binding IclR family transcriptional regulator